jgi:signal transduction histidine kinase
MYRWLAVLRFVLVANAIGLDLHRGGFSRPVAAGGVLVAMVLWTCVISWAYHSYARRTTAWVVADLVVALAALASTAWVKDPGYHATVPGFWVMGAMLAWAIHWRLYGGVVAAVLLSVDDFLTRHYLDETVYGNLFLLVLGGAIVGLMVDSLLRSAARTAVAERVAAAATERTRLSRAVHDGVLQVLALVQRRGSELGSEGAELARLAGEQEAALRALIRQQDAVDLTPGLVDLVGELSALERRAGVSLAAPSGGVLVQRAASAEIVAVVAACLDNVVAHVGPTAPAWILLEETSDQLLISVRDDGPGIPEGRLEEAARQGRLGVSSSIRGRILELGGTATVTTGPGGTEWELALPRPAAAARGGRPSDSR